jgi:hypothetical protein
MNEDIFALFIGLVAVLMASAAILIPIIGLTARYAFGGWIDRFLRLMEARHGVGSGSDRETLASLEQRLAIMDRQLEENQQLLRESLERNAFYERLLEKETERPVST